MKYSNIMRIVALISLCLLFGTAASGAQAQAKKKAAPVAHAPAKKKVPAPTLYVPAGYPKMVVISKIGVKAPVESVDLNLKSEKDAPNKWGDVAWYDKGPKPGMPGRASVYGHLDSYCCPAVFWNLHNLRAGDVVQVYYKTGKPVSFRVQWGTSYTNKKLPLKFIFGSTKERGLVLITCFGEFTKVSGYSGKYMIYARAIMSNGKIG